VCDTGQASKANLVTGRGGLLDYEMLTIPNRLDSRLTDGSKVVRLNALAVPYSPETFFSFWYSFMLEA
jgi:hypothetical protein